MYEGTPDFPDKDRWWEIVERYGVDDPLHGADRDPHAHEVGPGVRAAARPLELRLLGSVGEPINPEAWIWYHEHIGGGRCPIVDTWWQTETGMILITPLPGHHDDEARLGDAAVPRRRGGGLQRGRRGGRAGRRRLPRAASSPWPAMLRGIYGDDARYRETYWSKYGDVYFAGDGARIDSDGDFWLLGRVDDVMNVSGHRISTIEVESALVDHHEVAEAAVAARNDAMTGQAIVAFVTLKGGAEGSVEKLEELRNHVADEDRPDREAGEHRLHAGAAEDPQRQDHAPPAARRGREPAARRHDDARRPDRRRRAPGARRRGGRRRTTDRPDASGEAPVGMCSGRSQREPDGGARCEGETSSSAPPSEGK